MKPIESKKGLIKTEWEKREADRVASKWRNRKLPTLQWRHTNKHANTSDNVRKQASRRPSTVANRFPLARPASVPVTLFLFLFFSFVFGFRECPARFFFYAIWLGFYWGVWSFSVVLIWITGFDLVFSFFKVRWGFSWVLSDFTEFHRYWIPLSYWV